MYEGQLQQSVKNYDSQVVMSEVEPRLHRLLSRLRKSNDDLKSTSVRLYEQAGQIHQHNPKVTSDDKGMNKPQRSDILSEIESQVAGIEISNNLLIEITNHLSEVI